MLRFLLRRLANYLVLVLLATCIGYFLAATSLHPRANFEGRNPPPPEASVDRQLNELNLNDKTPVVDRFARWLGGAVHGDFGRTVSGGSVTAEMRRRLGVTLRLLLLATVIGGLAGVLLGAVSAVRQYRLTDYAATLASFAILSTPCSCSQSC